MRTVGRCYRRLTGSVGGVVEVAGMGILSHASRRTAWTREASYFAGAVGRLALTFAVIVA
jgi:hypothetical protein